MPDSAQAGNIRDGLLSERTRLKDRQSLGQLKFAADKSPPRRIIVRRSADKSDAADKSPLLGG